MTLMKRRDFLLGLSTAIPAVSALGMAFQPVRVRAEEAPAGEGWRTFEITTTVQVAEPVGRTLLWLPVPSDHRTDYQRALDTQWTAPGASSAGLVTAPGYDVTLLRVEWLDPKAVQPVTLTSRVATRDRAVDLEKPTLPRDAEEKRATLRIYLHPTALLQTDGITLETAQKITRSSHGDVEKARAIYEWVVENSHRDPKTPGCGMGDVASLLKSGYLGGKCADINGLFVALARSVQIPARDAYGIRVADSRRGFKSLGRSGDISKAQHCRAEFYARGYGWIPVDPADVRKVVLEEKPGGLPMSDPLVQAARANLCGGWEMNWIAYNHGHDVALPGSAGKPIPFLMYPNGETVEGRLDSLDPTVFRYEIHSRELGV
jgi:transglutaminase-like putative cysteine protease